MENSCYNTRIQVQSLLLLVLKKKKKEKATAKVRVDMESEISISICSAVCPGEKSDNLKFRNVRAVLVLYLEQEE